MVAEVCGCGVRFAIGLMRCPRCQVLAPRFSGIVKEDVMPRITVAGGASNPDAEPGDAGYTAPVQEAPAVVFEGEHGPELLDLPPGDVVFPVGWTQVGPHEARAPIVADPVTPEPDYASMTQAALRELAKSRGLPVGGSKADLAARLADNDAGGA